MRCAIALATSLTVLSTLGAACRVDPSVNHNSCALCDDDGDGFTAAGGDCDDRNAQIHPEATEVVDGLDNNCDGKVDDDLDGDGYGVRDGDCDDEDPTIFPGARERCADAIDNNCNGFVDEAEPDKDGDGYGPCQGDCNDNNKFISPGNVEDPTDLVDNNCNGVIDEIDQGCDCGAEPGETLARRMARAIGLCNQANILSIQANGSPLGYGSFTDWGALVPRVSRDASGTDGLPVQNCEFAILASGQVKNLQPQEGEGMDLGITNALDPAPLPDGAIVNDLTQLEIRLRVPGNARGFSFDFIFFSAEYPEYVCSEYNDTFYALVIDEPQLNGGARTNLSFDSEGSEITVNNGFFEYPPYLSLDISGTAYEMGDSYTSCTDDPGIGCVAPAPCPRFVGSTTGWLRTSSPATPGQEITLIFSIHDEGDNILDSAVILDNFRWHTVPIEDPGTVK